MALAVSRHSYGKSTSVSEQLHPSVEARRIIAIPGDRRSAGKILNPGAAMVRAVYSVVCKNGQWTVELNDKPVVRCSSRDLGVQAAVLAATHAVSKGYKAHVLAQDGARFRSVWAKRKTATASMLSGTVS